MAPKDGLARSLLNLGVVVSSQPAAASAGRQCGCATGAGAWQGFATAASASGRPRRITSGGAWAGPLGGGCIRGLVTSSGGQSGAAAAALAAEAAALSAAAAAAGRPRSLPRRLRATLRDYKQLSKAKLSALVVLTASAGFAAGSDAAIDWAGMAWTSLGTFGAAACANTLNQVYERANDALMARTQNRPLPAGRMTRGHALAFAAVAGAAGLYILAEKVRKTGAAAAFEGRLQGRLQGRLRLAAPCSGATVAQHP
jgi:hypothetical protein